MSTEKNAPDDQTRDTDETQQLGPVDETAETEAPGTQTLPFPAVEPEPGLAETEPATPVAPEVETLVIAAAAPEQPIQAEPVRSDDRPSVHADATDPFDLLAGAPAPALPPQPEPASAAFAAPAVVTDSEPVRRRLRVGTVVWGLILAACGLGVIAWASGARIDFQLALIVLLAVAGTALLVGSILSGARQARR